MDQKNGKKKRRIKKIKRINLVKFIMTKLNYILFNKWISSFDKNKMYFINKKPTWLKVGDCLKHIESKSDFNDLVIKSIKKDGTIKVNYHNDLKEAPLKLCHARLKKI